MIRSSDGDCHWLPIPPPPPSTPRPYALCTMNLILFVYFFSKHTAYYHQQEKISKRLKTSINILTVLLITLYFNNYLVKYLQAAGKKNVSITLHLGMRERWVHFKKSAHTVTVIVGCKVILTEFRCRREEKSSRKKSHQDGCC